MSQRTELTDVELEKVRVDFKKALEKDPKMLSGSLYSKATKSDMAALILSMHGHIDYLEDKLQRADGNNVWTEPTGEPNKKGAMDTPAKVRTNSEVDADFQDLMLTQKTQEETQTPEWVKVRRNGLARAKEEREKSKQSAS
jgi:hypothetical protein